MEMKSLETARREFLWRTCMLDTRTTMPGKYGGKDRACPHCREGREQGREETPGHWLECEAYTDLRVGLDPEYLVADRAKYLGRVIERREKLEKELKR